MIYRVAISLLTLASIAHVHAALQALEWPIRIQISKPTCDSTYYVQSKLPAPYAQDRTLGQLCQQAHQQNLPWCFLIASINKIHKRSYKKESRPVYYSVRQSETHFYDAAVIYSQIQQLQQLGIFNNDVSYLQQVVDIIAPKSTNDVTTNVDLVAFNCYPNGLITMLDSSQEDQLDLQLDYTTQLYSKKEDIDPTSFRQLVYNYSKRHNQLSFQLYWGELTDTEVHAKARYEAAFWLGRYTQDSTMTNGETDKALSDIQAFRVLKKD